MSDVSRETKLLADFLVWFDALEPPLTPSIRVGAGWAARQFIVRQSPEYLADPTKHTAAEVCSGCGESEKLHEQFRREHGRPHA